MVVGWVNYAGVVLCVPCANAKMTHEQFIQANPVWDTDKESIQPCSCCKTKIDQASAMSAEPDHVTIRNWNVGTI